MEVTTVKKILKETTSTGAGEVYTTPYAFSNGKPNKRLNKLFKTMGMELAKNDHLVYKNLWNFKPPNTINEELLPSDYTKIRNIIRSEMALLFYDLFKKRNVWK